MIKVYSPKPGQKLTKEQEAMVARAAQKPIVFDEDCPESTPEQLKAFRCAVKQRNRLLNTKKA